MDHSAMTDLILYMVAGAVIVSVTTIVLWLAMLGYRIVGALNAKGD